MPLDDPRGQLVRHAVERAAVDRVLEPRQRRLRGQALARNRVPVEQQLVDGVVGEAVAVVAVGMAAGDAEDALAYQVRERVPGLVRRPLVEQTPGERLDQTVDALGGLQQNRPAVGTGCSWLNWANSGLSNRSGNRTVCGTVSVVTQGPPWWRKWLLTLHLYHTGGSCVCTGIGTRHEFSGLGLCTAINNVLERSAGIHDCISHARDDRCELASAMCEFTDAQVSLTAFCRAQITDTVVCTKIDQTGTRSLTMSTSTRYTGGMPNAVYEKIIPGNEATQQSNGRSFASTAHDVCERHDKTYLTRRRRGGDAARAAR